MKTLTEQNFHEFLGQVGTIHHLDVMFDHDRQNDERDDSHSNPLDDIVPSMVQDGWNPAYNYEVELASEKDKAKYLKNLEVLFGEVSKATWTKKVKVFVRNAQGQTENQEILVTSTEITNFLEKYIQSIKSGERKPFAIANGAHNRHKERWVIAVAYRKLHGKDYEFETVLPKNYSDNIQRIASRAKQNFHVGQRGYTESGLGIIIAKILKSDLIGESEIEKRIGLPKAQRGQLQKLYWAARVEVAFGGKLKIFERMRLAAPEIPTYKRDGWLPRSLTALVFRSLVGKNETAYDEHVKKIYGGEIVRKAKDVDEVEKVFESFITNKTSTTQMLKKERIGILEERATEPVAKLLKSVIEGKETSATNAVAEIDAIVNENSALKAEIVQLKKQVADLQHQLDEKEKSTKPKQQTVKA